MRGKDYAGVVLEFGETSQCRLADISDKLNVRRTTEIFVGKLAETDEFLLIAERGLIKARAVTRLSGEEAWDAAFLKLCKGSPRNPTEQRKAWREAPPSIQATESVVCTLRMGRL